jgi:hypothetical protein
MKQLDTYDNNDQGSGSDVVDDRCQQGSVRR